MSKCGPIVEPLDLLAALAAESESRAAELLVEFGVELARFWSGLGRGTGGGAESSGAEIAADIIARPEPPGATCRSRRDCGRS